MRFNGNVTLSRPLLNKRKEHRLMPLYDFKCLTCNIVLELKDTALPSCPDCGETMARIWDAPAVKFKGPGFYSTGG